MKYHHIVVKDGKWYPAGAEVPEDAPLEVESPDNDPEGAMEENHAEEAENLQERTEDAFEEPEKAKRGKKKE